MLPSMGSGLHPDLRRTSFPSTARRPHNENTVFAILHRSSAPVPIAVTDGGKKILVGNSNRFAASENDKQSVTVIDAGKISSGMSAVLGTIPAQGFPREFGYSADGRTLFLSNFTSNTLEIIDVERLPIKPKM